MAPHEPPTIQTLETQRSHLIHNFPSQKVYLPSTYAHTLPHPSGHQPQYTDTEAAPVLKRAGGVIRTHIKLLQEYNAVKDVAQGLMGILAEKKGVRIVDIMEEFGIDGEE